jgi:FdhD protein
MEAYGVNSIEIIRVEGEKHTATPDLLAVEEPLEIRLSYGPEERRTQSSISVTMRTPGHDHELTLGFLFTEGIISSYDEVKELRYCEDVKSDEERNNVILVYLHPHVEFDLKKLDRHFYTTSSCGVCGKASIDAIHAQGCSIFTAETPKIEPALIHQLPDIARKQQMMFKHTGGLHAATIFSSTGELLCMREDIGRHNALDKVIGAMLAEGKTPLNDAIVLVSGRAGFELIQKAVVAGIPVLCSVGAPSSLAAKLAVDYNLTLCGFVRNERFNVYSGKGRVCGGEF